MGTPSPARTTFGCEVVELHDEVLVAAARDLDIRAVDEFRQRLADATRPGQPLLIDRTAATFIDGRGYRAIRAAASWLPDGLIVPRTTGLPRCYDVTVTAARCSGLHATTTALLGPWPGRARPLPGQVADAPPPGQPPVHVYGSR